MKDRLEISEVSLKTLTKSNRLDSSFYNKDIIETNKNILKKEYLPLKKYADFIIGPFGSAFTVDNYVTETMYRYIRGKDVGKLWLNEDDNVYMNKKDYERLNRYHLQENDILISVVGSIGKASIVQEKNLPAVFSCKNTIIRTKSINPYFLLLYLNSSQMIELQKASSRGAVQQGLNLPDLENLPIIRFSDNFIKIIVALYHRAHYMYEKSIELYKESKKIILEELNLINYKSNGKNTTIKSLSSSFFESGRLDAEYYQVKYDEIMKKISEYETTIIDKEFYVLNNSYSNYNDSGIVGVIKTKQLVNFGAIDTPESYITQDDLMKNNLITVEQKDVLMATMGVGSLGKVSLVTNKKTKVTDSTLRILRKRKNGNILPEYLLMFLESEIGQELIYRNVVGSTGIINIYDESIKDIVIPILSQEIQEKISEKVDNHFKLKEESEMLLANAIKTIGIAIERDEREAIKWIEKLQLGGE